MSKAAGQNKSEGTQEAPEIIVITGPTASGKSALALQLAEILDSEIISADSRQIYREIPIVTAQPSTAERQRIRHHLIGEYPLEAYFSASEFEQEALRISATLRQKGKTPIICGGSMMYVDALCNGIDDLPTVSNETRGSLTSAHKEKGDEWLLEELRRLDPAYYQRVDLKNIKRVFHAVEICIESGKAYSELLTGKRKERPFKIRKYALTLPREELFARINQRVEKMVEEGLLEEIEKVRHYRGLNSLNTVGVKEILRYFDGEMTLEEAISRIQKNTRVYAKKQLTWLKRDSEIIWLSPATALSEILKEFEA